MTGCSPPAPKRCSIRSSAPGQFSSPFGVAVEQSSGKVYVLDGGRKTGTIQAFSANGSAIVGSFGEQVGFEKSIGETPDKFHQLHKAGIAVGSGGVVYVTDSKSATPAAGFEERVMVFEGGAYACRNKDIAPFPPGTKYIPDFLATDITGNLYIGNESAIYRFSPSDRLVPDCKFILGAGGILGMAVDQTTGAPFYSSQKGKKEIHQLGPCNSGGEFKEVGTIPVSPQTSDLRTLAFNPALSYEVGRPPGVLYAADGAELVTEAGIQRGVGHIFAQAVGQPPVVDAESVSAVGGSAALLEAEINPKGNDTSYVFQ